MARERRGRSLAEDVYGALRADILFGRRLPASRVQLNEIAEEHGVSLSVVREAVTRLASEELVEATPQRGFRVRPLSVEHLRDLTWVRVQLETLALRESIAKGDVSWEADLVAAHHRLAVTPTYFEDGTGNLEWLTADSGFHAALAAAAGNPILERLRRQLYDAAELYRMWSSNLPQHPTREHVDDEHRAIFDAALARDADRAVELVTRHLETTADHLEAIAPDVDLGVMTSPPVHPVLIVNARSGGGKAVRNDLVTECEARGIEAIPFELGDDLASLATAAIDGGADAIGMAGGDGSQAAVAAVAVEHDIPFVCVPAGTRNHFALDLGIDRRDVVGALDAFVAGDERRIDLGRVNGRLFVNNVAMGLYGSVVQSPQYRDHKVRTVVQMLPDLLGPEAESFDLRFREPGGGAAEKAALVLVSNNPYIIDPRPATGTRANIDGGVLGLIAVTGPPPCGLTEWSTAMFRVDSGAPVAVGIDGESVMMEPPLLFESIPKTLRVRVPTRRNLRPVLPGRRGRTIPDK